MLMIGNARWNVYLHLYGYTFISIPIITRLRYRWARVTAALPKSRTSFTRKLPGTCWRRDEALRAERRTGMMSRHVGAIRILSLELLGLHAASTG